MSGQEGSDKLFLNAFIDLSDSFNEELSSDEDASSISDKEPEYQDTEDDLFSGSEDEDEVDKRVETVSGHAWGYIPPENKVKLEPVQESGSLSTKSQGVVTRQDCFHLFINDEIIDMIIRYTNQKGNEQHSKESRKKWKPIDRTELNALFGILLISGRFKESREGVEFLWRKNAAYTRPIYQAVMSRDRFREILNFIRFDDPKTRDERKSFDKLAALRRVTDVFAENCGESYQASNKGTIDDQLLSYRGKCPFKVYMPNRTGVYGIRMWMLCDVETFYCSNIEIYLGKHEGTDGKQEQDVVKRLSSSWKQSGRTVTLNNRLTNINLVEDLLKENIFIVGALKKNIEGLPRAITAKQAKAQAGSSDFLFTDNLTLMSYVPKPKKYMLLLSSLYNGYTIPRPETNHKPDLVTYYESTKGCVEILGKLLKEYSCRRRTKRWPLSLFMHYIDIAAYNAFIIWVTKKPEWEASRSMRARRKIFLEEVAGELVSQNIERRAVRLETENTVVHKHVARAIEATGRRIEKNRIPSCTSQKRSRCYMCISNDNKYRMKCGKCDRHICKIHGNQTSNVLCTKCATITTI